MFDDNETLLISLRVFTKRWSIRRGGSSEMPRAYFRTENQRSLTNIVNK